MAFKTGLGGITKAQFQKPKVQTAYKTKIAKEINKQTAVHDHAHRRRLASGTITAADITIKSITTSGTGITFEIEITVKETSGAGTDLTKLATEVQNRANNLIEKLQKDTSFAATFKSELKTAIKAADPTVVIDDAAFTSFDIGKATKAAVIKKDSSSGAGAAIGGAVAGVIVVGGVAFQMWKKKQEGGAGKVTPQA